MKKKTLLILIPSLLFLICFNPTVKAMSTPEGTGADDPGIIEYVQRFDDLSGVLVVMTEAHNTSGVLDIYITALVVCDDANRIFKLKIYDSDEKSFIDVNDEDGIGIKSRPFSVTPHPDFESLIWTAVATDIEGILIYAQISLQYFYDEEYDRDEAGDDDEDDDSISKEEHEKAVKKASRNTALSYLTVTFIAIILTGAVVIQRKGTGIKAFIKSKIRDKGD